MKKHQTLALVLAVLAVAAFSSQSVWAQFSPPSANPPASNVAPPINTGNNYQEKKSNIFVRLSQWPTFSDPTWNPSLNGGGSPSPYAFDTNAWARSWGVQTRSISVGSPWATGQTTPPAGSLFIPYASDPNMSNGTPTPNEKTLCVSKVTGFVKACGGSSGGNNGGGDPTAGTPTITFTVKVNGQTKTGVTVGGTLENYDLKNQVGYYSGQSSPQVSIGWQTTNADLCWANSNMGGMFAGDKMKTGSYIELFNGLKDVTVQCYNATSKITYGKTARLSINYYGGRATSVRLGTEYTGGTANFRWRESTNPISVNYSVVSPDIAPVSCRKKVVLYEHAESENGIYDSSLPFVPAGTSSGYWSAWSAPFTTSQPNNFQNSPNVGQNYTCGQFFRSGCAHGNEGARTVDLFVQCYNNQNGQTMENPAEAHTRLQWLNPDY